MNTGGVILFLISLCLFFTVQSQNCGCAAGQCCSKWGYCGNTDAFCGEGCKSGPCSSGGKNPTPKPVPVPNPVPTSGKCGCGPSQCCSKWGYCGNSAEFCGTGCQAGPCFGSPQQPPPPPTNNNNNNNNNNNGKRAIIATWYCSLTETATKGVCFPGSCGTFKPAINGFGIAAMNPQDFGSGDVCHHTGKSCGQCWAVTGPGGTAKVQVTDCCAGYPGKPSCMNSKDPYCDWCAANDHQHFDLDWASYETVCGNQIDQGHCRVSNAVRIPCPAAAVAEDGSTELGNSNSSPAKSAPAWAVALLVIGALLIVALITVIVLLVLRVNRPNYV